MIDCKPVSLETINSGAVFDFFEEEFKKVISNIADENTPAESVRSITLKISIKPSADRGRATTTVEASSRLASIKPNENIISFSFDGESVEAFTMDSGKQQELPLDGDVSAKIVQFNRGGK